jgi:ribonuclease HI
MGRSVEASGMSKLEYDLFTDGACIGNPGPGGWAYILRRRGSRDGEVAASGRESDTTNNRMELTAVIRGLQAVAEPAKIHLCGDSEYVLKGISQWLAGWKQKGWRKADKKPVLNADLWQMIDQLLAKHRVEVHWTRGHSGHDENERCDAMANAEARQLM